METEGITISGARGESAIGVIATFTLNSYKIVVRYIAAKDGAPDLSITPTEQVFTVDQTRRTR